MTSPHSKAEIVQQLREIQQTLNVTVQAMPSAQFEASTPPEWSASGYLKHLLLSVKPLARAMAFNAETLENTFGISDHSSRPYDEVITAYKSRLSEGVRAEDFDRVTPDFYRFPEGIADQQTYLVQSWDETNNRLINAIEKWSETDLDRYQVPHPAIGMLTLREILFFTIHHNTLHTNDIQRVSSAVAG